MADPSELTEPTFAVVPPELIRHSDLAAGPLKLLVYLIGCRAKRGDPEGDDPEFYWRPAEAAQTLNCTGRAVRKWRAALEVAGIYREDGGPFSAWLEMSDQPGYRDVPIGAPADAVTWLHPIRLPLDNIGLPPGDWRLLMFLESWSGPDRVLARWSIRRLARETGRERKSCQATLDRLARAGCIRLWPGTGGAPTLIGLAGKGRNETRHTGQ
ncbi:MAG: MarR family transcriptional regulator [Alphaproteobacteria bacterium]|nr:MarR family transcriptional regulator [Alphaproteobacteria bacterium]